MFSIIFSSLLFPIVFVNCIPIPFIRNVTLFPRYRWNSTTVTNQTAQQCLCLSMPSFVAFNWFPNNTCQLFYTFPITYKIQSTPEARLYFPQGILPNASQCCMPDLTDLLDRLNKGTRTYVNVTQPRHLLIDNHGYLVTVELQPPKLDRFDAQTLVFIDQTSIPGSSATAVAFANNAYFVGLISGSIMIIDSGNLTVVSQVSSSQIQNLRSIAFLDHGLTMVVSSISYNTITFFRQTSNASLSYTFAYQQPVNCSTPHGLTVYNNSFFYATSYTYKSVYSYSAIENSTTWTERLVIDASSFTNMNGGSFVTVDDCGRYWFSSDTAIVYIFDPLGVLIGNFSFDSGMIMDTLITNNYVMYFSNRDLYWGQIIRIDPHIEC